MLGTGSFMFYAFRLSVYCLRDLKVLPKKGNLNKHRDGITTDSYYTFFPHFPVMVLVQVKTAENQCQFKIHCFFTPPEQPLVGFIPLQDSKNTLCLNAPVHHQH